MSGQAPFHYSPRAARAQRTPSSGRTLTVLSSVQLITDLKLTVPIVCSQPFIFIAYSISAKPGPPISAPSCPVVRLHLGPSGHNYAEQPSSKSILPLYMV